MGLCGSRSGQFTTNLDVLTCSLCIKQYRILLGYDHTPDIPPVECQQFAMPAEKSEGERMMDFFFGGKS